MIHEKHSSISPMVPQTEPAHTVSVLGKSSTDLKELAQKLIDLAWEADQQVFDGALDGNIIYL
jgi:hypothetical protein